MKSAFHAAAVLAIAGLGLAACSKEPAAPTEEASPAVADAVSPEAPEGISIAKGRLVLPAVKGNPGAVYFDITNASDRNWTIASVYVVGAAHSMIHQTMKMDGMSKMEDLPEMPVPKGETVKFEPGGNHVMAMQLTDMLNPGDTTEVTVIFTNGDKVSFTANVVAAGDTH